MDEKRHLEADETTDVHDTTTGDGDVDVRAIVKFAIGLLVVGILVFAAMWLLSRHLKGELVAEDPKPVPIVAANPLEAAPGPRLQSDPNADMAKLRAEENAALGSYAWLSADKATARIPVERAMEILLVNGLPKATGGGPISPEERAAEGAGAPATARIAPPAAPPERKPR
jgi:hypothetical protein